MHWMSDECFQNFCPIFWIFWMWKTWQKAKCFVCLPVWWFLTCTSSLSIALTQTVFLAYFKLCLLKYDCFPSCVSPQGATYFGSAPHASLTPQLPFQPYQGGFLQLRNSVFITLELLSFFSEQLLPLLFTSQREREGGYHLHSSDDIILIRQNNRV